MSSLQRLITDLQNDESLNQEVQSLVDQPAALTALLARRGYEFSAKDLEQAAASSALSDKALEGVSGGIANWEVTLKFIKEHMARAEN